MSLGEELRKIDDVKITEILDRIYNELGDESNDTPELAGEDYRALEAMARYGFRSWRRVQSKLEGDETRPTDLSEEDTALIDQFMRGVSIGVWAGAAALKEYAELEKFEAEAPNIR